MHKIGELMFKLEIIQSINIYHQRNYLNTFTLLIPKINKIKFSKLSAIRLMGI